MTTPETRFMWRCADCRHENRPDVEICSRCLKRRPAPPTTGEADEEWRRANQRVAHLHTPLNGLVTGAAAGAMSDADRVADSEQVIASMAFMRSVVKSGESWDAVCDDEYAKARAAALRLRSSPVSAADGAMSEVVARARDFIDRHDNGDYQYVEQAVTALRAALSHVPSPVSAADGALREAAGAMTEERWQQIVREWTEHEPGIFERGGHDPIGVLQETIAEVTRLRAALSHVPSSVAARDATYREAAADPAFMADMARADHVCGLQGFGLGIDDRCPACELAMARWQAERGTRKGTAD